MAFNKPGNVEEAKARLRQEFDDLLQISQMRYEIYEAIAELRDILNEFRGVLQRHENSILHLRNDIDEETEWNNKRFEACCHSLLEVEKSLATMVKGIVNGGDPNADT